MRNDLSPTLRIGLAGAARMRGHQYQKLLQYFGSDEEILIASHKDLITAELSPTIAASFVEKRSSDFSKKIDLMAKETILYIGWHDRRYPPLLRQINDPPLGLFVRGDPTTLLNTEIIAVVGTRTMTSYGELATRIVTGPLAKNGLTIASGLALGVDAVAHRTTLDACEKTIAVLGSGLDGPNIGPSTHWGLAEEIVAKGGALVSEYSPGTGSTKYHFPERNRIIAGLSRGIIVIEAKERSGALITARLGLEYNRDVFALPGPITSVNSYGTNRLIKDGAIPLIGATDVLEYYGYKTAATKTMRTFTEAQQRVLHVLSQGNAPLDMLVKKTSQTPQHLFSVLSELEVEGVIKKEHHDFVLMEKE